MLCVEEALKIDYPAATEAECKRFLAACQDRKKTDDALKKEASDLLENYLNWRSHHGLNDEEKVLSLAESLSNDSEDWQYAVKKAVGKQENANKLSQGGSEEPATSLPQFIYLHTFEDGTPIKDRKGHKLLHVLPAMIDRKAATAEMYGLAIAIYLDRKFDRASDEKMTLLLDVRAGAGWPNPNAFMMITFVRKITKTLQGQYPGRCGSLILFPVPRAAMSIWGAIKKVFHSDIMDTIALVPGPASRDSPIPKEVLERFIDGDVLDLTESKRVDKFRPCQ